MTQTKEEESCSPSPHAPPDVEFGADPTVPNSNNESPTEKSDCLAVRDKGSPPKDKHAPSRSGKTAPAFASIAASTNAEVGAPVERRGNVPILVGEKMEAECGAPADPQSNAKERRADVGAMSPARGVPNKSRDYSGGKGDALAEYGAPQPDASVTDVLAEVGCSDADCILAQVGYAEPPLPPAGDPSAPGAYSVAPNRGSVLRRGGAGAEARAEVFADEPAAGVGVEENVIATAVTDASTVVYANKVQRDRSKLIKIGACLLASVGIIVGVTVGVIVGGQTSTTQVTEELPWRNCVPTESNITKSSRYSNLQSHILSSELYLEINREGRDAAVTLDEPCSPQDRALTWLADDDGLVIGTSWSYREQIFQRFAMATFFFSTSGPEWLDPLDWLSEKHECEWDGVQCVGDSTAEDANSDSPEWAVRSISLKKGENQGGGMLPREIGFLQAMVELNVGGFNLGGRIPTEMARLFNLFEFFAPGNQLTGPLPEEIFSEYMASLRILNLGGNKLSGSLPQNIGQSKVAVLALPKNRISGTLPSSFVEMENIAHFMLPRNQLVGTIPADIGKLNRSLAYFDVSQNQMEGTVPDSMTNLLWLTCLGLSDNGFVGTLPAHPECLGRLAVEGNFFHSAVPEETCSHFDEYKDRGAIICGIDALLCPCCQECPSEGVFCRPGKGADLPGRCSWSPPDSKLPGFPPPGTGDGGMGRPPPDGGGEGGNIGNQPPGAGGSDGGGAAPGGEGGERGRPPDGDLT